MNLSITRTDDVDDQKAQWIEDHAQRVLVFTIDCRDKLKAEAHTTLQWLFALIVGGSGFLVSLFRESDAMAKAQWWLIVPVGLAVVVTALVTIRFLRTALCVGGIKPPGNEPKNLATDSMVQYDLAWMRLSEAASAQDRIEANSADNAQIGLAINRARLAVCVIPPVTFVISAVWWAFRP